MFRHCKTGRIKRTCDVFGMFLFLAGKKRIYTEKSRTAN